MSTRDTISLKCELEHLQYILLSRVLTAPSCASPWLILVAPDYNLVYTNSYSNELYQGQIDHLPLAAPIHPFHYD